jgi:ABC-2 type transport system ATP-binding protein
MARRALARDAGHRPGSLPSPNDEFSESEGSKCDQGDANGRGSEVTDANGAAIRAEGLVKRYEGGDETVEAVRGVDLAVETGEIFGFLGPNGAGKSTTVRMLTTLLTITAGRAEVAGADVEREPDKVRKRIGVALQEAGLDPRQTGRELLVLHGRLFGLSKDRAAKRAQELLELVDITDAADRVIKGYSGGMKRRLDLAAALVHQPDLLFLDEPTTGLDPASRLTIWEELRRINGEGTTVFLTTQYLEEADHLCDRLAIIDGGRIVREGTPGQLKADLRDRNGGGPDPTLDDVFLDATGRTRARAAGEVQEVQA